MPSAQYVRLGTQLVFNDTAGATTLGLNALANGALRISDRVDLGAFPRPVTYRIDAKIRWQAGLTANRAAEILIVPWGEDATPTLPWGDDAIASTDATASVAGVRFNMLWGCAVRIYTATSTLVFTGGGIVDIPYRYVSIAVFNDGGSALHNANDASEVRLTPMYREAQ